MPAIDTPKEFKNSNACRNSPRPSINFKQLLACSPESPQELMKSWNWLPNDLMNESHLNEEAQKMARI